MRLSGIYRWCTDIRKTVWHLQMVHIHSWDCLAFIDGAQTFMRLSNIYRWWTDAHETVKHSQMVHRHSRDSLAFTNSAQTFIRRASQLSLPNSFTCVDIYCLKPLIGCQKKLIQYIRCYPPYVEVISLTRKSPTSRGPPLVDCPRLLISTKFLRLPF
jgi:hypothetical protein